MGGAQSVDDTDVLNTEGLIGNLTVELAERLSDIRSKDKIIVEFIVRQWLPQRETSVRELTCLVDKHKKRNTDTAIAHLTFRSASTVGKIVAISTVLFPPIALGGLATAGFFGILDGITGAVKTRLVKKSIKKLKKLLKKDLAKTEKLKELISDYKLLLADFEGSLEKLRRATIRGAFDRIKSTPAVRDAVRETKCIEEITLQTIPLILKPWLRVIRDARARADTYGAFGELLKCNPGIGIILEEGLLSCLTIASFALLLTGPAGILGACIIAGLNIFSLSADGYRIGQLIVQLQGDGTDEIVTEINRIVRRLEAEKTCVENAIKYAKEGVEDCTYV